MLRKALTRGSVLLLLLVQVGSGPGDKPLPSFSTQREGANRIGLLPLPEAKTGYEHRDTNRVTIRVSADGQISLGSRILDPDRLEAVLAAELERPGDDVEARIRVDGNGVYGSLRPILRACVRAGVCNVTFAQVESMESFSTPPPVAEEPTSKIKQLKPTIAASIQSGPPRVAEQNPRLETPLPSPLATEPFSETVLERIVVRILLNADSGTTWTLNERRCADLESLKPIARSLSSIVEGGQVAVVVDPDAEVVLHDVIATYNVFRMMGFPSVQFAVDADEL